MEEAGHIDSRQQKNISDTLRPLSRILEELFESYSQHVDFIPSIVFCIRELFRKGSSSDKGQAVLKKAVNQLAEFCSKSVWVQLLTFDAIHRLNIPELIVLMINACRNLKNGFTVPVRLLLHDRLPTVLDNELLLPSYAMAVGENSSFNLGVPSDGPVKEARKVPLEAVKKVSMSSNHALFLTYKGEVFACGATTNFDTGESNGKLVVNPIKITFPNEVLPIVDLSAGPHHSVFITKKVIYVCGVNNKFCLGLKKDGCHYVMKHLKLPFPERARGVQLDKVYTNEECTIIFSSGVEFCEIWIAGKTPNKIHETFKIMDDTAEVNYGMIRGNVARIGINNALEVLYWSAKSSIFPVSVAQVNYQNRGLKNVKVVITNSDGILNYTFDTRPGREYIQPCVISVNGFLVDIYCVDYHTTLEGDVLLLGYLRRSKSIRFTSDFYTLYRGKLFVIEDKVLDDGFTEVYSNDSNLSGLRLLIMLQEVPGAHTVSSFTCSPDGKNLIYVTNSATIYRIKQWQTADYFKLNENREIENLNKLDLNFHIYDVNDVCWDTFVTIIRARFPNLENYTRNNNNIFIRDLINEVDNIKCSRIFYNYLIFNENRISKGDFFPKYLVEDVCRVLGVPCVTLDKYYQIGHPLQCLDDFIACYDCILISEEGTEIKFVRKILEIQSSYFTVAFSYQNSETPRLQLRASEKVIRCTLLTIINQNYLRCLQLCEFVDLLPFFDQYLLHSVVADAIRIIFEQVNEFSVGFIFDLYDVLPQVRLLLAEYFFNNLHLITLWKNSLTASVDLIRDVFSFAELDISQPDRISSALDVHFSLEPPSIYILGDYQKVDWSLFRTEDILDILTEHPGDTSQELEILNFLQDNGLMRDYSKKLCSLKECTKSNDSVLDLPASKHEHPDVKQKTTEHFGKNVLNSNVYDEQYKSTSLMNKSTEDLSKITVPPLVMSSMKRRSGRFTPKGVKFRCANNLLVEKQSGTHFAPWAAIATSPKGSGVLPMSMIFEEEMNRSRKIDNVSVSPLKEKTRPSQSTSTCGIPWNEAFIASSSALSSSRPSLIEIIKEEEQRLKKGYSHVSQPLHFIEDEERAIEELTQLYRENAGDELIVRVERCNISSKITMPNSLWTNFPRSNF